MHDIYRTICKNILEYKFQEPRVYILSKPFNRRCHHLLNQLNLPLPCKRVVVNKHFKAAVGMETIHIHEPLRSEIFINEVARAEYVWLLEKEVHFEKMFQKTSSNWFLNWRTDRTKWILNWVWASGIAMILLEVLHDLIRKQFKGFEENFIWKKKLTIYELFNGLLVISCGGLYIFQI